MEQYQNTKERIYQELLNQINFSAEISDQEIQDLIEEKLRRKELTGGLDIHERIRLGRELFYMMRRLDILQELLDDPEVTEIMINGMDNVFVERTGRLEKWPFQFDTKEKLQDVIQQIVSGCNRVVNEASPIVDARLQNGSRVNIVLDPVALNGPVVTIRRFPEKPIGMQELLELGALSKEAMEFLKDLVKARYNIFISGGTGSGKTTFLNALAEFIPEEERLITVEDSAELQIRRIENLVRLETRNANVEGCRPITIRDLIRTCLRMRPDRIIVGEVRGGEAVDLITGALNCGHDGSMSTGHANSAQDMLSRLETMMLMGMEIPLSAIRRQIASGVDIIIHLGRLRDHSRKVLQIVEVVGMNQEDIQLSVLYEFAEEAGMLIRKGDLLHVEKLRMAGMVPGEKGTAGRKGGLP